MAGQTGNEELNKGVSLLVVFAAEAWESCSLVIITRDWDLDFTEPETVVDEAFRSMACLGLAERESSLHLWFARAEGMLSVAVAGRALMAWRRTKA